MKSIILYALHLAISTASFGQDKAEVQSIKSTFDNYKKSILEDKGSEAIRWVDAKTLAYYEKILYASIHADSAEVQDLGLMDRLIVITVRHRVPKSEVLAMDGKGFLIYSINKGMIGKNSVLTIDIGEVKVSGNFANGQVVSNGQPSPLYFQFNKEGTDWKIDLTSLFPASTMGLKRMISENGMTENEFIFQAMEMLTGKLPGNEVWHPLK
ncbi:MAG: hypothetical protein L0Y35_02345 [Flammeovirgaceae bacterium]|nr:hypothetical protein [Flammeovirgaceae bacterium]